MTTYIIRETQNLNSTREGYVFTGTLTQAKRHASRNRVYLGSTLKIETTDGSLIASKSTSSWTNY